MSRYLVIALIATVGLVLPASARACDCVTLFRVHLIPSSGTALPLNGRPRVLVEAPRGTAPKDLVQWLGPLSLICVAQGRRQPIEVTTEVQLGYQSALLSLVPRRPLSPHSECLLLAPAAKANQQFRWDERVGLVGWFTVAGTLDETAPSVAVTRKMQGNVLASDLGMGDCKDGSARAWLPLQVPRDDFSAPEQLLLEVWFQNEREALDPSRPPTTWLRLAYPSPSAKGELGFGTLLSGGDFCWPGGNVPFPTFGERVRIGLRLVDTAGHRSHLREALLDGTPTPWQRISLGDDVANLPVPQLLAVKTPLPQSSRRPSFWAALVVVCGALLLAFVAWVTELRQTK